MMKPAHGLTRLSVSLLAVASVACGVPLTQASDNVTSEQALTTGKLTGVIYQGGDTANRVAGAFADAPEVPK